MAKVVAPVVGIQLPLGEFQQKASARGLVVAASALRTEELKSSMADCSKEPSAQGSLDGTLLPESLERLLNGVPGQVIAAKQEPGSREHDIEMIANGL